MKYLIGFIVGVLVTSLFFMYQLRKKAANTADPSIPTTEVVDEMEDNYESDGLPAGFLKFYQDFHDDSLYQINHVLFPLKGLPSNADSLTLTSQNFYWQKEDWRMHRPFENETGEYSRSFDRLSDGLVVETIRFINAPFGMQRRFVKTGEDWFLIYYAGMNRIKGEELPIQ